MFVLGFMVDILTYKRIYSTRGLIQQGLYLGLLGILLVIEIKKECGLLKFSKEKDKYWKYHDLIVHFLFGSLLSLYTIFFYTSASALTSFLYILILGGLMLANEVDKIRKVGISLRVTLFTICTLSFFSFLYPITMGRMGDTPFWLGVLSVIFIFIIIWILSLRGLSQIKNKVIAPSLLMIFLFIFAYYTSLIPPVPIAIKKIGVFHEMEKKDGKYIGKTTPSGWSFLRKKEFHARTGDKITVLLSIFSPMNFQDLIHLKWFRNSQDGWILEDNIPLQIVGGREEGFRGFATKKYFKEGEWRICVETTEASEVGRIEFRVLNDHSTSTRVFQSSAY